MKRLYLVLGLFSAALLSAPGIAAESTEPETVTISTASPGGTYYPYGHGLAIMLTKYLGVTFTDQPTQGPTQNVVLLDQRKAMLGMTTMGVALQAWNGTGWAKGTQYRAMRALFPMYDTPFQFAAPKRLSLGSLGAFAGKQIGDGPKAGTGGTYFPEIFKALDIPAVLRNGAWEDLVRQLSSGELDGIAFSLGVPAPDVAALDAKDPLDFFQPSPEQVALVRTRFPELSPSLIPSGTYPSLHEDYHTVGLYNFAIIHRDVSDDLVYRIVKAVFEHQPELVSAHPAAKETIAANLDRDTFLPLHPGAARYYREIGIAIPPAIVPAN
jgi:TRAP transporter TAXI family solute receptor